MSDSPSIEVQLTNESEFHCFKLVLRASPGKPNGERRGLEILLHTTQAIELHHQLGVKLSEYFHQASAELLRIKGVGL